MGKIITLFFGIMVGIFFVVFIIQNAIMVDVVLLGNTLSVSISVMSISILVLGILLGMIIKSMISWKRHIKQPA